MQFSYESLSRFYFNAHFRNEENEAYTYRTYRKSNRTHSWCTGPKQPDSSIPSMELPISISYFKVKTRLPWLNIIFHYSNISTFIRGKWLFSHGLLVYHLGLWPDISSCLQTLLLSLSRGGPSMFPWLFPQTSSHYLLCLGLLLWHCLTVPPQKHVLLLNFIRIYPGATGILQAFPIDSYIHNFPWPLTSNMVLLNTLPPWTMTTHFLFQAWTLSYLYLITPLGTQSLSCPPLVPPSFPVTAPSTYPHMAMPLPWYPLSCVSPITVSALASSPV